MQEALTVTAISVADAWRELIAAEFEFLTSEWVRKYQEFPCHFSRQRERRLKTPVHGPNQQAPLFLADWLDV